MSAPERSDPRETLRARQRQQCQAHGLRALAELVEADERASGLLDAALVDLGRHLSGADRSGDLEYLRLAFERAGAVLVEERMNSKFHVVKVQWSEHFGIGMQCDAPPAESDEPAEVAVQKWADLPFPAVAVLLPSSGAARVQSAAAEIAGLP